MKIAVIAHSHYAITQPFAGGLEAHTFHMVRELIRLGHDVTTYAKAGTDPSLNPKLLFIGNAHGGNSAHYDTAFKIAMKRIRLNDYDIIINNSLNHIPLLTHGADMPPMLTIFHTPPLPKMEKALLSLPLINNRTYLAVSQLTAAQWRAACDIPVSVVDNGIDISNWTVQRAIKDTASQKLAVWSGRITPEKGTHLAIEACIKNNLPLVIVGSLYDTAYFNTKIRPLLNDQITYLGHVDQEELRALYARADVALVTPLWDEPFGLVAVEALASGVPVAALPNGALPSIITNQVGAVADDESASALSAAITRALDIDSSTCRPYVESRFTLQKMVESYMAHAEALLSPSIEEFTWQTYP